MQNGFQKIGGHIYDFLISINRPLSKYLKRLTKNIVNKAGNFQKSIKNECLSGGYNGLMCGHIHKPELQRFDDYLYLNTGDWIESCTAIVEAMMIHFHLFSLMKIMKLKS